ncbi:MAG: hypothetical protein GXP55_17180 [Deltaproteobacteria bacterium]|nr:hypothetical protein [Deltaproteobacteria bacterium]
MNFPRGASRFSFFSFLVFALAACGGSASAPDAGEADAGCAAAPPVCTNLFEECCDDTGFEATCVAGGWVCDPCLVDSAPADCTQRGVRVAECVSRRRSMDALRLTPPVIPGIYCRADWDAGVGDAGSADAGDAAP